MEIKEPKFREGQKVRYVKDRNIYTIERINSYSFIQNEYDYNLLERLCTLPESKLELYIEKPKTVWDLQNGDTYYAIDYDAMNVFSLVFCNDEYDLKCRALGNCFLTKEEAESELERVKIEAEMLRLGGRRKFKHNRDNYGMYYSNGINVALWHLTMNQGVIYFDTRKEAEDAIEYIGRNRLKKHIFGVEE